jgi:hypothetical protein
MSQIDIEQTVRIHIDREPYESHNPTTGEALYKLGGVAEHHDLFLGEVGDHEDELIERNSHSSRWMAAHL